MTSSADTATGTLPAPTWQVVPSPRERDETDPEVWVWVEYKNLPVEGRGHQFTARWGDGLVDGTIVLCSGYENGQFSAHNTSSCSNCDAYASFEVYDDAERGPRLVYVNRIGDNDGALDCPVPDGIEWSVDLAVPSGRMIVADSLRPVYDVSLRYERDVPGYSSILGQMLHCKEQEAIGCAYGPTSNIALGLFRLDDRPDSYVIASVDDEVEPGEPDHLEATEVANICTDLWAYSIADLDHFIARARDVVAAEDYDDHGYFHEWSLAAWIADGADPDTLPRDFVIVDVTPGTYRFTHHGGTPDFDEQDWPLIWASVERLDDSEGKA